MASLIISAVCNNYVELLQSSVFVNMCTKLVCCSHLLTWGAGRFGQLGNNEFEDNTVQDIVKFVPPESGKVMQVCVDAYTGTS